MPLLTKTQGELALGDVHRFQLTLDLQQLTFERLPVVILIRNASPVYRNLAFTKGPFAVSATVEKRPTPSFTTPPSSWSGSAESLSAGEDEDRPKTETDPSTLSGDLSSLYLSPRSSRLPKRFHVPFRRKAPASPDQPALTHTSLFIICGQTWRASYEIDCRSEPEVQFDIEIVSEINHSGVAVQYEILVLATQPQVPLPDALPQPHGAQPQPTRSSPVEDELSLYSVDPGGFQPSLPDLVVSSADPAYSTRGSSTRSRIPVRRFRSLSESSTAAPYPIKVDQASVMSTDCLHVPALPRPHARSFRSSLGVAGSSRLSLATTLGTGHITAELAQTETTADVFGDHGWTPYANRWMTRESGTHLVVLTHGLMGSRLDELCLRERILKIYPDPTNPLTPGGGRLVRVLSPACNHGRTDEGITPNGARLAESILDATQWKRNLAYYTALAAHRVRQGWSASQSLESLASNPDPATYPGNPFEGFNATPPEGWDLDFGNHHRISFIGHSLGGLINLNTLRQLDRLTKGLFFVVFNPTHFISLATPYMGIAENMALVDQACQWGLVGQTGKELTYLSHHNPLNDFRLEQVGIPSPTSTIVEGSGPATPSDEPGTDKPSLASSSWGIKLPSLINRQREKFKLNPRQAPDILIRMGRPDKPYLPLLARFEHRTAYANVDNDVSVGCYTASLIYSHFDRAEFLQQQGQSVLSKLQHNSKLLWSRSAQYPHSLFHFEASAEDPEPTPCNSIPSPQGPATTPAQQLDSPTRPSTSGSKSIWQTSYQSLISLVSPRTSAASLPKGDLEISTNPPHPFPFKQDGSPGHRQPPPWAYCA
ncbi:hypothetical protein BJ085DRAFT_31037 [Dimargaris cristalligena]|uniref:DUF676 domain-containing protein n=1 Tax=Dimargaris cristalligena TaxID=215637 RepID=A0A4P9ZUI7_9FUNG|nr:hypothetical protein BJ085DRAFT_31037 [Dimargaris cristalligena]|eukprot:RKP37266.1 hypothetical protein BJ085DRAFT_31037 [Dimargaris cristalligena]